MRRRFSKAAIVIGLTVGFVTIGGGIALASTTSPAVQTGSQVTSNRGGGGDDNGRGGDDHGRGGDDHGGNNRGGGGPGRH